MYEYAVLLSTLETGYEADKFNCSKCIMRYAKATTKRAIEEGRAKRASKGCFDYTSKSYKIDNVVYRSCIGNFTVNIGFYIEAFAKYKLGLLPYNGTLGEQPNKLLEIFNIMEYRKDIKQKEFDAKNTS